MCPHELLRLAYAHVGLPISEVFDKAQTGKFAVNLPLISGRNKEQTAGGKTDVK